MFFSEDIDQTAESISDYINFTLSSNSTHKEFYTNTKHRPWVKPELKELFKQKSDAVRLNNRHQTKQIQQLIDAEITKAKAEYKEKMLAHMSSNMKKAWHGIKNMSGLAKPKDSNYDLMSDEEQTTLANSLNTFYTRFNCYTPLMLPLFLILPLMLTQHLQLLMMMLTPHLLPVNHHR